MRGAQGCKAVKAQHLEVCLKSHLPNSQLCQVHRSTLGRKCRSQSSELHLRGAQWLLLLLVWPNNLPSKAGAFTHKAAMMQACCKTRKAMSHRAGRRPYIAGVDCPRQADLHHGCAPCALHNIGHHAGPPCVVVCRQHRLTCLHTSAHPASIRLRVHTHRLSHSSSMQLTAASMSVAACNSS